MNEVEILSFFHLYVSNQPYSTRNSIPSDYWKSGNSENRKNWKRKLRRKRLLKEVNYNLTDIYRRMLPEKLQFPKKKRKKKECLALKSYGWNIKALSITFKMRTSSTLKILDKLEIYDTESYKSLIYYTSKTRNGGFVSKIFLYTCMKKRLISLIWTCLIMG